MRVRRLEVYCLAALYVTAAILERIGLLVFIVGTVAGCWVFSRCVEIIVTGK